MLAEFSGNSPLADLSVDSLGQRIVSHVQVEIHLKPQPETGGIAEIPGQPQRGIGGDGALAMDDLVDPSRGNPEVFAKLVLADTQRLEKLLLEYVARMYGRNLLHVSPLVIVDDLNVMSATVAPDKADSPLVVDSYAMLSFSFSSESFQAISRRDAKVLNIGAAIQHAKLPEGDVLDIGWQPSRILTPKDPLRLFAPEALYHAIRI